MKRVQRSFIEKNWNFQLLSSHLQNVVKKGYEKLREILGYIKNMGFFSMSWDNWKLCHAF